MEVKARPLVSEVRPLNQNQTQERRVSWNHDTTQKQNQETPSLQDQAPEQNRTNQDQTHPPQAGNQSQVEEEETSLAQQGHRPSPLKKKVQTAVESRRNQGPVARAATSHLSSSSGLRKAQSVQSLLTDTGKHQERKVNSDCMTQSVRARTDT